MSPMPRAWVSVRATTGELPNWLGGRLGSRSAFDRSIMKYGMPKVRLQRSLKVFVIASSSMWIRLMTSLPSACRSSSSWFPLKWRSDFWYRHEVAIDQLPAPA